MNDRSIPLWDHELGDPCKIHWGDNWYLTGTGSGKPEFDGLMLPLSMYSEGQFKHIGGLLRPLPDPDLRYWAPELHIAPCLPGNPLTLFVAIGDDISQMQTYVLYCHERTRPCFEVDREPAFQGNDASPLFDSKSDRLYVFFSDSRTDGLPGRRLSAYELDRNFQPIGDKVGIFQPTDLEFHTPFGYVVEGPSPVQRNGKYLIYCSGGYWETNYFTMILVADTPLGPYTDTGYRLRRLPGIDRTGHGMVCDNAFVLHGYAPGDDVRHAFEIPLARMSCGA